MGRIIVLGRPDPQYSRFGKGDGHQHHQTENDAKWIGMTTDSLETNCTLVVSLYRTYYTPAFFGLVLQYATTYLVDLSTSSFELYSYQAEAKNALSTQRGGFRIHEFYLNKCSDFTFYRVRIPVDRNRGASRISNIIEVSMTYTSVIGIELVQASHPYTLRGKQDQASNNARTRARVHHTTAQTVHLFQNIDDLASGGAATKKQSNNNTNKLLKIKQQWASITALRAWLAIPI